MSDFPNEKDEMGITLEEYRLSKVGMNLFHHFKPPILRRAG
jgi:hypothetical protein